MGYDAAQLEESSSHRPSIKVHGAMCAELKRLIEKISKIYPDIEAARPGASGIKALCLLQNATEKARLLIQNCCDSSRFYLALTGEVILSRCERTRNLLENSLSELQSMVPLLLAFEISQITEDLRSAIFELDASEQQAGRVIRALLQMDESILQGFGNSEIHALQFVASRLHLASQRDVLIEKRSIKNMLENVCNKDQSKRTTLKYFLHLLKKHDKLILKDHAQSPSKDDVGSSVSSVQYFKTYSNEYLYWEDSTMEEARPNMFHRAVPPQEFKCPISSRIMYEPVVIASGQTFEKIFIQKWFDEGNDTCPVTRMKLTSICMTPNAAMKDLISKWCEDHQIKLYNPNSHPSAACATSYLDTCSSNSVTSCASSLSGLHLPIDISSVSLGSLDTSYSYSTTDNLNSKIDDELTFSCEQSNSNNNNNDVSDNSPELEFFSGTRDLENGLLSDISQLPWVSQCMAVKDAQNYLNYYNHARVPLSRENFVEPIFGFLKNATVGEDVKAQREGARLLLTGLRTSRNALRCINEDLYAILASFLGTEIEEEVLSIFELSSARGSSGSKLASSGALIPIIETLDDYQNETLQETSIKIVYNLSTSIDLDSPTFTSLLNCIPRLVPLLSSEAPLSRFCLLILKNLCCTEKGTVLITETEGCISAIAELLDTGSPEDQETVASILLSLCSHNEEACKLVMDADNFLPSLIYVSVNGNENGKEDAKELLRIFKEVRYENFHQEDGSPHPPPAPSVAGGEQLYKVQNGRREECNKGGSRPHRTLGFFGGRIVGMLKVRR